MSDRAKKGTPCCPCCKAPGIILRRTGFTASSSRTILTLATVYRNLNQLNAQGLIRRVGTVNGQERYDGRTCPHSHFICNRCGCVVDLPPMSPGQDRVEQLSVQYDFTVQDCEVIVRGLCADCKES